MNRDLLNQICEAPVHLIADEDGMVIGNSQFLATRLRYCIQTMDEWLKRESLGVKPITKTQINILLDMVVE